MVDLIQRTTGLRDVAPTIEPRRAGDPARVVASAALIERELGWKARLGTPDMVASAWAGWQRRH
jgi:UDP-glucose 4-epimerase